MARGGRRREEIAVVDYPKEDIPVRLCYGPPLASNGTLELIDIDYKKWEIYTIPCASTIFYLNDDSREAQQSAY